MESIVKLDHPVTPLFKELLGESEISNQQLIEIHLDETNREPKKFSLGIEDTRSLWANMRSRIKPVSGDWLPAKDEILESLTFIESSSNGVIPGAPVAETHAELYDLLTEATSFLKEELGIIKTELSNIHLYKGAIQSLGSKISEKDVGVDQFKTALEESAWVIGSRIGNFEDKFEQFQEDLPRLQKGSNEHIIAALKEFEDKCMRLGATQLDSLLSIKSLAGNSKAEELQETLMYLISGQKRIFDSISEMLNGLKNVSVSVSHLPSHETVEDCSLRQEEKIDSLKLEIVESRAEDRAEERLLKNIVFGIGFICLLTLGAVVYSLSIY